jgi:DNA replication protein DnaC
MTKKIEPFIVKKDHLGNEYTIDNPDYQEKIQNERYEFFLNKSNIPSFYWNIGFDNYRGDSNSKEIKQIIYYAENCYKEMFNHVNLYLWGNQSTQKTALACNILKQGIHNGLKVKFILAGTLIDNLMKLQGFSQDEDIYYKIKELKNCDLLLIDDIGDINKSVYWTKSDSKNIIISAWDTFLREILSSNTKVVMTSNFDISIFKQYFGDSMHELIDRNFAAIHLTQSVKSIRKLNVNKIFEDIE